MSALPQPRDSIIVLRCSAGFLAEGPAELKISYTMKESDELMRAAQPYRVGGQSEYTAWALSNRPGIFPLLQHHLQIRK